MQHILCIVLTAALVVACGDGKSSYQESTDRGPMLVKRCANEAGIPANDPQHKITPDEMRKLTACVDRNK